jgi:peptide deformylase
MTILDIITYPDRLLQQPSEPVIDFDDDLNKFIEDMAETMFDAPGAGLAAVQVGVNKQIIVVNTSTEDDDKSWFALINPEITEKSGEYLSKDEGCLSVPELTATVRRYNKVTVKGFNPDGEPVTIDAEGFKAVVLQHETDHLKGTLFIDRISALKREMYKKKIKKLMKQQKG